MAARLTARQAAVLAAVERIGRPLMADPWEAFPDLQPSAIRKVLASLERKELIGHADDGAQAYLNGVTWWSAALDAGGADPRLALIVGTLERADLGSQELSRSPWWPRRPVLPAGRARGLPAGFAEWPAGAPARAERRARPWRAPCRLEIGIAISADPEPRIAIRLVPLGEP